jgi:dihydrofolate reductase
LEALLLGRRTYEIFAAYWPKQPAENPIAARLNGAPKYVLVDRLNLWVFPLLLGSGKRLFAEGTVPTALGLVESPTFPKGAVHLTYERAGKPTFGSMA